MIIKCTYLSSSTFHWRKTIHLWSGYHVGIRQSKPSALRGIPLEGTTTENPLDLVIPTSPLPLGFPAKTEIVGYKALAVTTFHGTPPWSPNYVQPPTMSYFSPINSIVGPKLSKLTLLSQFTTYITNTHTYSHAGGGSQGPTPAQSLNVVFRYFLFSG